MANRLFKSTECSRVVSPIERLPIEIITLIVKHLSVRDILALTAVSKIWRCVYLNQNAIWKEICSNLNLLEDDYAICPTDISRNTSGSKNYLDANSEKMFGPKCKWWFIYNRYNMVVRNIKDNDFPLLRVRRYRIEQSFCTDDYIVNVHRGQIESPMYVEIVLLKGEGDHNELVQLKMFNEFQLLYSNNTYSANIVGNKRFLVLEVRSVIFVYEICFGEFQPRYWKTIQKSEDYDPEKENELPDFQFFEDKHNTRIDISGDNLALIQPSHNVVFLINLTEKKFIKN